MQRFRVLFLALAGSLLLAVVAGQAVALQTGGEPIVIAMMQSGRQ